MLLGTVNYTLSFGNMLRLIFIRMGYVLEDDDIIATFSDNELGHFLKFSIQPPQPHSNTNFHFLRPLKHHEQLGQLNNNNSSSTAQFNLNLSDVISLTHYDFSNTHVYLDLHQVFIETGIDLSAPGPYTNVFLNNIIFNIQDQIRCQHQKHLH